MNISPNLFNAALRITPQVKFKQTFTGADKIQQDSFVLSDDSKNNASQMELFADRVYSLAEKGTYSLSKVEKTARRLIPGIKTQDIKDLDRIFGKGTSERYHAYTLPEYQEGCTLKNLTIFIPPISRDDSKQEKVRKLSSTVHEFAHCSQRVKDNTYLGLQDIANGNLLAARCLNNFSSSAFTQIELLKCNLAALESEQESKSEEQVIYNLFDCENQDEFKHFIKRTFISAFKQTDEQLSSHPDIVKYMPYNDSKGDLKRIVRSQCKVRAEMEAEAYTVQKHFIEKYDKENLTPLDIYTPVFYQEIAKALE